VVEFIMYSDIINCDNSVTFTHRTLNSLPRVNSLNDTVTSFLNVRGIVKPFTTLQF